MLNAAVTEPVLNSPGVVAGVRQSEAAGKGKEAGEQAVRDANKEAAAVMNRSPYTIETHRDNFM